MRRFLMACSSYYILAVTTASPREPNGRRRKLRGSGYARPPASFSQKGVGY